MKRFFIGSAVFLSLLGAVKPTGAENHFSYMPLVFKDYCTKALVFLAFGDSITSCHNGTDYVNFPNCGYPGRVLQHLKTRFGKNFALYNQGVRGETTYGGLERIAAVLTDPINHCGAVSGCLYPTNIPDPTDDLVLIMEGTNDHNMQYPFEAIDANLREMVAIAHLHGKKVIIATNPPALDERADRIAAFRPWILQIAADFHIPVADVYDRYVNYPGWENALLDVDGLHPNDLGFEVMADVFYLVISAHMSGGGCYLPDF
jgi:lysophospholipase L1-like esterase